MATFNLVFNRRDNGQEIRIRAKQRSAQDLTDEYHNICTRFRGVRDRTKMLREHKDVQTSNVTYGGVQCKILYTQADPHRALKFEALQKALELFQNHNEFAFPGNEIEVYMISAHAGTYFSNASVGFVYKDPDDKPNQTRIALILGDSIGDKVDGLLATKIHEYYKPTFTVNAAKKMAMAATFHEFGHIFHQLNDANRYFALADLQACAASNDPTAIDEYQTFPDNPSKQTLVTWADAARDYGRLIGSYASNHPNEVVSETFAALLTGYPLPDTSIDAYRAFGGLVPPTAIRHVRTGQNAFKKGVLYPLAKAVGIIGE